MAKPCLFVFAFLCSLQNISSAQSPEDIQDRNIKAGIVLVDLAARLCALPLDSTMSKAQVHAHAEAELVPALKQLVHVGVSAAGDYSDKKSKAALVESDVLPAFKDHTTCVNRIIDSLKMSFFIVIPPKGDVSHAPIKPSADDKRSPATKNIEKTEPVVGVNISTAFHGFSCQTASYGNQWAKENREKIEKDLYERYGCSEPPELASKPGFDGNFHSDADGDGPWVGFAPRSTILYYSDSNRLKAQAVAQDLSKRYQHNFVIARGAGQGILPEWYSRMIEIHLREWGF